MRAKLRTMIGGGPEEARRHGGVLAARALAVVLVADRDPAQALGLVGAGDGRKRLPVSPVSWFTPVPGLSEKALIAPVNMLSLIWSRCPR